MTALAAWKLRVRRLIPIWRSPSLEARIEAAVQGLNSDVRAIGARLKKLDETARQLRDEQKALRLMIQGTRIGTEAPASLGSETVPTSLPHDEAAPSITSAGHAQMVRLDSCPACGAADRTLVCEYNKLILLPTDADEALKRYDYCLCHGCGITYASCRPVGDAFRGLFEKFDDNLGRSTRNQGRSVLLSPGPLADADRAGLAARIAGGTLVSEHLGRRTSEYLPQLQADRLASSMHLEILGSHLTLQNPRVLEIRPRFGSILAALKRLYGASIYGLPMTEAQQFVMQQAYGVTATALIDFENFTIPYEGTFDLVIANHMLTHVLQPGRFLAEVRKRLSPAGHLYLYNEPDEAEFVTGTASMINTLNPFHMQTFDGRSLTRALAAGGFEPVFLSRHHGHLLYLGRVSETPPSSAIPQPELSERLANYRKARDLAILRVPESQRWRFRDEWEEIVARAVASGVAGFDEQARLHPARPQAESDTSDEAEH